MRRFFCAQFALAIAVAMAPTAGAQSEGGQSDKSGDTLSPAEQALYFADAGDAPRVFTASGEVVDSTGGVDLVQFASGVGNGPLNLSGQGGGKQFFVGGEYLSIRANFSQATSFVTTDLTTTPPGFTYNEFGFDYDESYRVYGGYRDVCCGCEVRFAFTNFSSNGSFQSPTNPTNGAMTFNSPGEVITGGPGDSVSGTAFVDIDNFDLGVSKTIPLGSPLGCCCGDQCGDGCCGDSCCGSCCNFCPAWDITWTGAVRVADVESELNYASNIVSAAGITNGLLGRTATSRVSFEGVGLRTGFLGRRYIGRSGTASLYMKGDLSLLLGDVEYTAFGTAFAQHSITSTQVVPVTEIEVGGSVFLTQNLSVTGGYLLSAWHDLGHRAEYDFEALGVQIESLDDANLLTLDGWFVRTEYAF